MKRFAMAALAAMLALASLFYVQPQPFRAQVDEYDQLFKHEPLNAQMDDEYDQLFKHEPLNAQMDDEYDQLFKHEPLNA